MNDCLREPDRCEERELARERLEERLLFSIQSQRSEMTQAEWQELREKLLKLGD